MQGSSEISAGSLDLWVSIITAVKDKHDWQTECASPDLRCSTCVNPQVAKTAICHDAGQQAWF